MKFKHYQTKSTFLTDLGDNKIVSGDICFIKDAQQIYTHGTYYDCSSGSGSQSDWNQNDTTADDYIKNRTHYVESVSYTDKWNQSNVEVGSGSSSPGAYSGTFTVTAGNKYRVIITNGNNSKTYTDIEAEYNSSLNGMLLNKNWSNPMQGAEAQSDAFFIHVQASSVILASVDVYGSNCTVQVSEITENVKKLDRKYLPALNEIDHISSSKSGSVTTVTITETEGATTSFQISDGANGTNGTNGTDGKSAYQVAVDNGYSGTEAQWLASLKGDSGVDLGQVAVTSTVTMDTDKVPSDAAVYRKVQRLNESDINEILSTGEASEPTLPFGYTELEWIYNENGSSGIDTGLIPDDTNWRFVGSWARMKTSGAAYTAVFSTYKAEASNCYRIARYNTQDKGVTVNAGQKAGSSSSFNNVVNAVGVWNTFDLSYGTLIINGSTNTVSTTQGTANTNTTLKLLNGSYYARLKTFQAYHNDVLVGNFVPAKRDSDGEIGMYDTVTNVFFEHINANAFTAGPEVPVGKDRVLNGEGLTKAVSTSLNGDSAKLPTVQAVKEGIEVWRDNISYIYSANDLNFDGTNYVNTEWNPYSTDSDFEIRMQISDLLLDSMSNSDTIISCIKQVSPYPGFSIRRNSDTKLGVYINGGTRIETTVNKGVGSTNTIIFKRVGDVYTFTVNETSTSYTYPSNGVDNSEAITLYIGGYPDANNIPYRFGKFYLDTLTIRNLEYDVQLYADYQKNCKIYPNVSVNSFVNMEHCNGVQLGGSYFKLTQEQLDLINSYDECTIRCIMRADDNDNGSQDWRYFSIGSGSSSTFHISTTYTGIPIVCGKQISDIGAQTICHPLVWSIVLNKKLGTVKYYRNQNLYLEDNSDNFKITNFFTNYLYTSGGDNGCKYYDVAIYNTNYANHLRTSAGQSFETAIDNTGILPVFKNFQKAKEGWTNLSTYKPYGSYTSQTVSGTDVINYHTAASSAGTMGGTSSNGAGFTTSGYAAVVEIPFTTDKQIWIQQYRGQLQYINVLYNEQGEVIPFDETHTQAPAKKIPAGNYTLVVYNYSAPNLYIGEYWTAEAEATITIHQRRYRWICAVIHLCCNCIYEGNKIYDDVSKQFYLKYTSNSLTTSGHLNSQNTPSKYILTANKSVPHFVGEIKTVGDNIYQANKNYVWKQINNS